MITCRQVVEIVSDAARELPYGLHLLSLTDNLFFALQFGRSFRDLLLQRGIHFPQRSFGPLPFSNLALSRLCQPHISIATAASAARPESPRSDRSVKTPLPCVQKESADYLARRETTGTAR